VTARARQRPSPTVLRWPAALFLPAAQAAHLPPRLRRDRRVVASMKAIARAMSPSTWPVTAGVLGVWVAASAIRPAGLALRPAAEGSAAAAGLGVGEGVISGNRPDAFPAPMTVVLAAVMTGKIAAAFPGPISVLVALSRFGRGPRGSFAPRRAALAKPADEALADGLEEAERVGLALAERVGVAEWVGLALGVGDAG
jgi:hypothetical protein